MILPSLIYARILGLLLLFFSLSFLPPALLSLLFDDHEVRHFLVASVVTAGGGAFFWLLGHRAPGSLRQRDGFIIVALFWFSLGLCSALPFISGPHLSLVDALFEAISGLTTTGATILEDIERLPPSLLYYRQQLQWLGGAGVVVLAVAVMPLIGVGGMQLYKAETPGPMKEEKLTPRITQTARALWYIYLWLTIACAVAYWLGGMSPFDAINHSFATVSTGGFSTWNSSIGHYHSALIEGIAMLFMLLGAINFSIHFLVWRSRGPRPWWHDEEVRTFLSIMAVAIAVTTLVLWLRHAVSGGALEALRQAAFQVISVITSTGFGTADFSRWPLFLPVLLIFISFIGGCGGSTAGGMKVARVLLLARQGWREIARLIHPRGLIPVRFNGRVMNSQVMSSVWGFFSLYVATFVGLMLVMMASGLDQVTAFSAVATSLNNLGPGLGRVATSFHDVNDVAKLAAVAGMILGRLEIFTILVLFTPAFWRR